MYSVEVVMRIGKSSAGETTKQTTNIEVMNSTFVPTLRYGCKLWCLSKQQESRVQAIHLNVLRKIEGVRK